MESRSKKLALSQKTLRTLTTTELRTWLAAFLALASSRVANALLPQITHANTACALAPSIPLSYQRSELIWGSL
jgi:hypothetical protein